MQDVADRVGLSRPLVSIVLRGAPGASEESRERVLAAAREIGYYPDDSARMLRLRRSRRLGVLFTMRQPFEADLVDALYAEAGQKGFTLALSHMGPGRPQSTALEELMGQRIEALIVLAAEDDAASMSQLPDSVPVVMLGGPRASGDGCDDVRVENAAGTALAVSHLMEQGHQRIAYIGPADGPNAAERLAGYTDAMAAAGLADCIDVFESGYTEVGGSRAAEDLLTRPARPTALVCANDRCAVGVMGTLIRAGVAVPDDMSVVGFDDSSAARFPFLDLTSVRPDPVRMAALAIEVAEARIEHPGSSAESVQHRVPVTLAVRSSTGPARAT